MIFDNRSHELTVTLSHDDWKKLTRASITQRQSLTRLLNTAIHYAVKDLDRFGRAK